MQIERHFVTCFKFIYMMQNHFRNANLLLHDSVPGHKTWFIKARFANFWVAFTEPWPRPYWSLVGWIRMLDCSAGLFHPTSVPDLTNALVAEWEIPPATFQTLVESLPKKVKRRPTLEWHVQQIHIGVMIWWSHTLGHIMYNNRIYFTWINSISPFEICALAICQGKWRMWVLIWNEGRGQGSQGVS